MEDKDIALAGDFCRRLSQAAEGWVKLINKSKWSGVKLRQAIFGLAYISQNKCIVTSQVVSVLNFEHACDRGGWSKPEEAQMMEVNRFETKHCKVQ